VRFYYSHLFCDSIALHLQLRAIHGGSVCVVFEVVVNWLVTGNEGDCMLPNSSPLGLDPSSSWMIFNSAEAIRGDYLECVALWQGH
jgi:hypothetical protein